MHIHSLRVVKAVTYITPSPFILQNPQPVCSSFSSLALSSCAYHHHSLPLSSLSSSIPHFCICTFFLPLPCVWWLVVVACNCRLLYIPLVQIVCRSINHTFPSPCGSNFSGERRIRRHHHHHHQVPFVGVQQRSRLGKVLPLWWSCILASFLQVATTTKFIASECNNGN